jgi:AcrR family transcriptional regulator
MRNMRTTRSLHSEDTANRIFHQAMRLFLDKGYHGTSIDDITKSARITKGALYWHFKGKEDLLQKIVKEFENRFVDELIRTVGKMRGGGLEKFEKYIRFNSAFAFYNPELCVSFTTLAAELVGTHKIRTEIKRIYKKYQDFLSGIICEGKEQKVFKKGIDPALMALVIIAFHDGILHQWWMNRDQIDGKAYVSTFKKTILEGLKA